MSPTTTAINIRWPGIRTASRCLSATLARNRNAQLLRIALVDGKRTPVTTPSAFVFDSLATPSPDGHLLAFGRNTKGNLARVSVQPMAGGRAKVFWAKTHSWRDWRGRAIASPFPAPFARSRPCLLCRLSHQGGGPTSIAQQDRSTAQQARRGGQRNRLTWGLLEIGHTALRRLGSAISMERRRRLTRSGDLRHAGRDRLRGSPQMSGRRVDTGEVIGEILHHPLQDPRLLRRESAGSRWWPWRSSSTGASWRRHTSRRCWSWFYGSSPWRDRRSRFRHRQRRIP